MKKIVVPTDFSLDAEKAYGLATQIAKRSGGEIILLHITTPHMEFINDMSFGAYAPNAVFDQDPAIEIKKAKEKLEGLIKSKIPVNPPPGFSKEDFVQGTIVELIPHMRNFNPEINDSFSGWINSQLSNKIGNVFMRKRFFFIK